MIRSFTLIFLTLLAGACSAEAPLNLEYHVVNRYSHNPNFYTQGLLFYQGQLMESTGQYGESQLIRYQADFTTPVVKRALEPRLFGEGIAVLNDRLYLLTWKAETAFIFEPRLFSPVGSFSYQGEGWGLTSDGNHLWFSSGNNQLARLDGEGQILSMLDVTINGSPLDRLNELEYVSGMIAANRWYDDSIYFIDPQSGKVLATLNLSAIAGPERTRNQDQVLNGIAWHPERKTLFITGKDWSTLYELSLPWLTSLN